MQKNWYIVYSKPKCEKKVAASLTKRKIENFYPVNCKHIESGRRSKVVYQSLFDSYVFAYIPEIYLDHLKQVANVVSLVYWKGQPAVINNDEVEAIKELTHDHHNLKLVRTPVDVNDRARIVDGPTYSVDGRVVSVKHKSIKVNLPSLGFTIIAEIEEKDIMGREAGILQNNSFSYSS